MCFVLYDFDPWEENEAEYRDKEGNTVMIPGLDRELVTEDSMEWITQMRFVGLNKESSSRRKCFISGEGTCDDGGVFFASHRSEDPVFPNDEQCLVAAGHVPEFRVCFIFHGRAKAMWPEDGNFFCFHAACYEVLKHLAAGRLGARDNERDDLDATLLYSFFRYIHWTSDATPVTSRLRDPPAVSPLESLVLPYIKVDRGYRWGPQGQFWVYRGGEEVWVSNPFDIPELREYYDHLPRLFAAEGETMHNLKLKAEESVEDGGSHGSHHELCSKRQRGDSQQLSSSQQLLDRALSNDPLRNISPELLMEIFIHLPAQSIVNLKIASSAARHVQLSNWFWWKRIQSAMPCLFDLPGFHGPSGLESIDWHQVYVDLTTRGRGHGHGKILGLVNRHRIWTDEDMVAWATNRTQSMEQDVEDAIKEWGDRPSFRSWRDSRGQSMSGDFLRAVDY